MAELTSDKMIILFAVVFPLALLLAAIVLGSGICVILPLLIWIGVAVTILYLPEAQD
jgi:hypothetical protein